MVGMETSSAAQERMVVSPWLAVDGCVVPGREAVEQLVERQTGGPELQSPVDPSQVMLGVLGVN